LAALWPVNRNEYQEYFLRGKGGRAYDRQLYHLHVPTALKSGSLRLLEPNGPVIGLYMDFLIFTCLYLYLYLYLYLTLLEECRFMHVLDVEDAILGASLRNCIKLVQYKPKRRLEVQKRNREGNIGYNFALFF